ncbi:unnamed protein product [Phaedon cochleariae]|uniref:Peptidase M14 domain-containing protein n=1 Tax=Phaedon cochleariae TaxID=80249 RepID=A0A9N9SD70_PHACE|nr:unnamed protein product [Phaedon cochleariae]
MDSDSDLEVLTPPEIRETEKQTIDTQRLTETDKDIQIHTDTYRYRQRQTDTDRDRQRQTETDRDRQRQTETDRDRQRQTETDRDRQRQTETDRDRQRQTETDRDRQRQTETDRDRQRQTETDRDRQRQTETDRDRQRQTETDRDRQRQTETARDRQRQTETDSYTQRHTETLDRQKHKEVDREIKRDTQRKSDEEVPFEIEEPEPVLKNIEYQDESNSTNVETAVDEEIVGNADTTVNAEIAENATETTSDAEPSLRVSYTGNQLWKTFVGSTEELRVISNLKREKDISTWGGNHSCVDILVKPESLEKVSNALSKGNIKYEIVIKDLQKAIDEENPPVNEETNDRKGYRLTWKAYHGWTDIHSYLDYVAETYPDLCTLRTIGQSVEGKPIKVLKISNGKPSNKAVWIDGGIHAREWISPATATYLINHLVSNLENEPPYMREIDWYFAPLLNPDGYEYSHKVDRLWRKNRGGGGLGNCRGTDLNRNFG